MLMEWISSEVNKRKLHFALIDPDQKKIMDLEEKVKKLEKWGTDAIMVGGSTNVKQTILDEIILKIRDCCNLPIILFPGGIKGISRHADAIFFMSLLNSKNPFWITQIQASSAKYIKQIGIEPIPLAYLVIEPGMTVGRVGEADLIKRTEIDRAVGYALAAQMFGFKLVYLEAGSGADMPVPVEMVAEVRKNISIPIIVGGGLRNKESVVERLDAGADIIVTGTIIEDDIHKLEPIIRTIKNYRRKK